jgi:hypothetical protein
LLLLLLLLFMVVWVVALTLRSAMLLNEDVVMDVVLLLLLVLMGEPLECLRCKGLAGGDMVCMSVWVSSVLAYVFGDRDRQAGAVQDSA